MAAAASKFNFNQGPPKRRVEIKLKIFKTIAKSLQNLATGVSGEGKKAACKRVDSSGSCSSTCRRTGRRKEESTNFVAVAVAVAV
ncbi:hypothetical protein L1887_22821 [Cichorium endivia]|nr:hypothetical protein L1887_22821 [Cichorium endivia]